jgi:RNA polymerase sigma factor (sigma-70 family)
MIRCIGRAREGTPHATAPLAENPRPRITKMAVYYGRICGEDADDLLQEAWVGLLEALPQIDVTIGSPEQHLIARARWRLLDALKRARVRRCSPLEEETTERIAHEKHCESPMASACVSEFTEQLKVTQKQVLDCLLAGHTWRETGQILGCTSANIAYYVRQIRQKYEEYAEDVACPM